MAVEYRKMRIEDEDAVFGLRLRTWNAPSIDYVRAGAYLDPRYLDHTFVAIDTDGTLLSTVRYWLRHIRDAAGTPRLVGCVASVVTIESARRQGHARELMELAIESMREDGCEWTLLSSSRMGRPLYEGLGYRLYEVPYYRGVLSGERPQTDSGYSVQRLGPPFDIEDETWKAIREIYATYNSARPLSLVRDEGYWRGYFLRSITASHLSHTSTLFVARESNGLNGLPVGYLIAYLWLEETARELDQSFAIAEIGAAPGHPGAITNLLSLATEALAGSERAGMSAVLPPDSVTDDAMHTLLGDSLDQLDERRLMARTLNDGFKQEQLDALFSEPGAFFWPMDDF